MPEQDKPSRGEQLHIQMIRKRLRQFWWALGLIVAGIVLFLFSPLLSTNLLGESTFLLIAFCMILVLLGGILLVTIQIPKDPKFREYIAKYNHSARKSKSSPIFSPIVAMIAMIRLVQEDKRK